MKRTDLAYLAGFFDGEGCISLRKSYKKGAYELVACVGQANQWIIRLFEFNFGGSVKEVHDKRGHHRASWQWTIATRQASAFLEAILPYLKLKRQEAEIALKFQGAKEHHGWKLTDEEFALEEAQALLVHNLKDKSQV